MQRYETGEVREPGGGEGVDRACSASGSSVWSDRHGFASPLWNLALGINPLVSLNPSLISERVLITASVMELFGD